MFVCFFVCPIITLEPMTDLPQILIGDIDGNTGMFFACFEILS